ncbi:carbamoyl phosphate synthase small subunit [Mechercharimyces sp. CAU 1602]|uniref:carbamoyl phosphate synthase small subunit n=1 Tax=Mechercharimyces sp. CAU 1602 TaxID=2973933 RepID=UPI0021623D98|nr:carbamoyl phosphate synthase small subunit [Mechercharimyces sp. CAU 1602]MCS1350650.1 carbamoyl phosphate synthase small subunit [Mechercharimyces sp. CAU 1602]
MKAYLLLEDGTLFTGESFGAEGTTVGEVVFNTGMTGYQEVLTDPSYCGQLVAMTYPLIGNYGINRHDMEAMIPHVHAFIVREHADSPHHWQNELPLGAWLQQHGIMGISGIDTRMLTRKLRRHGTMKGRITTADEQIEQMHQQLQQTPLLRDQVARVSTKNLYTIPHYGKRVVMIDYGAKAGLKRELVKRGCEVIVVPHDTTVDEIERLGPDGIFLSNGPGDPKDVPYAIEVVKEVSQRYPTFGVCLGHQLLALAFGGDTEKMQFGHRGCNHPVTDLATKRTVITSQNHGYAVCADSIETTPLVITHLALNDGSVEGLRHQTLPVFSVQYHPEAAPGPHDSAYLFDQFIEMMEFQREQEGLQYAER